MKMLKNILWLLPFICFLSGYVAMRLFFSPPSLQTPALVGCSLEQALAKLSAADINIRIVKYKEAADIAPGTIISQSPLAKSSIKKHQTVYCVVSRSPEIQLAPQLVGKSWSEIKPLLEHRNVQAKLFHLAHHSKPETCIAQFPAPDMPLRDKNMIIYISQSMQKPVIWPSFKNKPVTEVTEFLDKHTLKATLIHTIEVDEHHHCDQCKVIDQRPVAGALVTCTSEKKPLIQLQVG